MFDTKDVKIQRQAIRDTIIFFDPVLIEGDTYTILSFIDTMMARDEGFYQLRINPQEVRVVKKKLTSLVHTNAGYERAYFGNDITTLTYRGTTGHFWIPQYVYNNITRDVRLSPVWQKFKKFEVFFDTIKRDIKMISHDGDVYSGTITSFEYALTSDNPFEISYTIVFQAYTDELARQNMGEAIQRLSYLSMLTNNVLPGILARELGKAYHISETVPGRAITSLVP